MASLRNGPLRAFRISDRRHKLFDAMGSYLMGGRWTSHGRSVIHAAETYAGALLEILVHSNVGSTSDRDSWIDIVVRPPVLMEEVGSEEIPGWDAADLVASRAYGDRWYDERRTAVLLVPSLVTRGIERNVLINQDHPQFSDIVPGVARPVSWDERLFKRSSRAGKMEL